MNIYTYVQIHTSHTTVQYTDVQHITLQRFSGPTGNVQSTQTPTRVPLVKYIHCLFTLHTVRAENFAGHKISRFSRY